MLNKLIIEHVNSSGQNRGKLYLKKQYPVMLPLDAAINTVKEIKEKYPPPYTLMVSGGVDSQAMLWAWHKSGVEFQAINFKYVDHIGSVFNAYDTETLEIFSKTREIPIEYRNFNFLDFLDHHIIDYVVRSQCTSPQLTMYMAMAETIKEGTVILSGNPIMGILPFNYTQLGLERFGKTVSTISFIPFFFLYSGELAYSFKSTYDRIKIQDPTGYTRKCHSYTFNNFPVVPQQQKYTGFEKIKEYYDNFQNLITPKDRLKFSNRPSKRVYDIKYRYSMEQYVEKFNENLLIEYTDQ